MAQRNRHGLAVHAVHVQVERVGSLLVAHLERNIERPVGVLLLRQMVEGPQALTRILAVLNQVLRTAAIRHVKVPNRSARNIAHIIASCYLGSSGGNIGRAHARFERHTLGSKRILRQVVFNLGTAEFIGLAGVLCSRGTRPHGKLHALAGRCVHVGHIAQQAVDISIVDLDARGIDFERGAPQRQRHFAQRNERRDNVGTRSLGFKAHEHIGARALLHVNDQIVALPRCSGPPGIGAVAGIARTCGYILDRIFGQRNLDLCRLAVLELVVNAQLGLHPNDRRRISDNRARRQPALGTVRLNVKRRHVERHIELLTVFDLHLLLGDMLARGQPQAAERGIACRLDVIACLVKGDDSVGTGLQARRVGLHDGRGAIVLVARQIGNAVGNQLAIGRAEHQHAVGALIITLGGDRCRTPRL